jgi:hypothetical protein
MNDDDIRADIALTWLAIRWTVAAIIAGVLLWRLM